MKIRFTYHGRRRSGDLERFYHARNGNLVAKVILDDEDGGIKTFSVKEMLDVESGPQRSDEEVIELIRTAVARWMEPYVKHSGNPLELALAAMYVVRPDQVREATDGAVQAILTILNLEGN